MEESSKPHFHFIIDASFILSHLLPDERIEDVTSIFDDYSDKKLTLASTTLLPYEVMSGLNLALRRKRINKKVLKALAVRFLKFKLNIHEEEPDNVEALKLAEDLQITVYDASYVYLAKKYHVPLLTLDQKLRNLPKN